MNAETIGPAESATRAQTILVVEDDEDVAELVIAHLTLLGYGVVAARSGREALAALHGETPIDLLFTDLALPENMSGTELAKQARRLQPDIKVLLTTGYRPALPLPTDAAEEFPILAKPYRQTELTAKVRAALQGGRIERAASEA